MGIQVLSTLQLLHSKITIYDTTLCKIQVLFMTQLCAKCKSFITKSTWRW